MNTSNQLMILPADPINYSDTGISSECGNQHSKNIFVISRVHLLVWGQSDHPDMQCKF